MTKKRKGHRGGQRQRRPRSTRHRDGVSRREFWLAAVGTWIVTWFGSRPQDASPPRKTELIPQPLRVGIRLGPPRIKQLAATLEGAPGSFSAALTKST